MEKSKWFQNWGKRVNMGKKLPPKQLDLYQGIDEILWKDWDPIGIHGNTDARDEYYAYLPIVFNMALKNASTNEIAQYLHKVADGSMGLKSDINSHMATAEKIVQLKTRIDP